MGFFRLLLASLVLASHCGVAPPFIGVLAVECFFVISGFYIQMILSEQYMGQPRWVLRFWESRALRIFVPYWVIMLCILTLRVMEHYVLVGEHIPFLALLKDRPFSLDAVIALFTNLFIVGSDYFKQIRIADACGSFFWDQLVIQPVWSVGTELLFYAIAPLLLLCRSTVLLCIVLLSAAGKSILLYGHSYDIFYQGLPCGDGLLNSTFPLEFGVFITGALGYRIYRTAHLKSNYLLSVAAMTLLTAAVLAGLKIQSASWMMLSYQLYLLCVIPTVPFLFAASRSLRLDRYIGELSYPFYLWHHYFVDLMYSIDKSTHHLSPYTVFIFAGTLTLLAAMLIVKLIEAPLSAFRHRYFRRSG
jgi:peptidoglycan/LPS O-acetylase OafA/YrhL